MAGARPTAFCGVEGGAAGSAGTSLSLIGQARHFGAACFSCRAISLSKRAADSRQDLAIARHVASKAGG